MRIINLVKFIQNKMCTIYRRDKVFDNSIIKEKINHVLDSKKVKWNGNWPMILWIKVKWFCEVKKNKTVIKTLFFTTNLGKRISDVLSTFGIESIFQNAVNILHLCRITFKLK